MYVKINKDGSETGVKVNAETGEEESDGVPTAAATAVHDKAREFFVGMENGACAVVFSALSSEMNNARGGGADDRTRAAGDEASVALWKKFRNLSIAKYKETYARLNIYFDLYHGESQVGKESQTEALRILQELNLTEDSKGALIIDLEQHKLGKTILRKTDGTNVYLTRDIGGAAERWEKYHMDKSIYVVASQQDLHNAQVRFLSPSP